MSITEHLKMRISYTATWKGGVHFYLIQQLFRKESSLISPRSRTACRSTRFRRIPPRTPGKPKLTTPNGRGAEITVIGYQNGFIRVLNAKYDPVRYEISVLNVTPSRGRSVQHFMLAADAALVLPIAPPWSWTPRPSAQVP